MSAASRGVRLLVEFDGGSRGNPGNSGCGAVVLDADSMAVLQNISGWLPAPSTNNEAEYNAALLGVRAAVKLAAQLPVSQLVLQGDSQLVLNQLSGKYEVRSSNLASLHEQVTRLLSAHFAGRYELKHVLREYNARADALANAAMDTQSSSSSTNTELLASLGATPAADAAADAPIDLPRPASLANGVRLLVEFDGGSRGNPGNSGCGAVVLDADSMVVLQNISGWLPAPSTNNEAEYNAALLGVRAAVKLAAQLPVSQLVLQGDSQLVLNQLSGKYEVRSSNLASLHEQVTRLLSAHFAGRYELKHVLREYNARADALANVAMDTQSSSSTTNTELLASLARCRFGPQIN